MVCRYSMWCHRYYCTTPLLTCWEWANRSSYIVDVPGTLKAFWLVFRVLQFQFHGQRSLLTTCSFRGSMKQNIHDEHKKPRGVQQSLWVGLNTGANFSPAFSLHWQLMISVKLFYVHYPDPFVLFLLLPFVLMAQKGSSHCLATKYKPGHHQSIGSPESQFASLLPHPPNEWLSLWLYLGWYKVATAWIYSDQIVIRNVMANEKRAWVHIRNGRHSTISLLFNA